MRLFTSRGYHLARLALPAKLTYTVFLVFIALGLWTSWKIYTTRIGGQLDGPDGAPSVAARYGPPRSALTPTSTPGPALDLEGLEGLEGLNGVDSQALAGEGDQEESSDIEAPWLLDVFHQHAFSVSVIFLILAHLFMLTRLSVVVASAVIAAAGLSALAHVVAPLIIHASGSLLWLMPASGALMGLSWTLMVLWTLLSMWLSLGLDAEAR